MGASCRVLGVMDSVSIRGRGEVSPDKRTHKQEEHCVYLGLGRKLGWSRGYWKVIANSIIKEAHQGPSPCFGGFRGVWLVGRDMVFLMPKKDRRMPTG